MGMKHFTPISRDHPGLVQVLHVGRNDDENYFYYVMEAADDAEAGRAIDPDRYTPKNLSRVLQQRGCLSIRECLRLCVPLASALAYLHERHLIHRDIKPSNIIFVNDAPKIADIGLVTDVKPNPSQSSFVGTEDFLPRQGYGLPSADVYALGKVLYLVSIGSLQQFPALPTDLSLRADGQALLAVNDILLKACDDDPAARYPSARELHAALVSLQSRLDAGNRK
jgi:serine/threonine protein kinase